MYDVNVSTLKYMLVSCVSVIHGCTSMLMHPCVTNVYGGLRWGLVTVYFDNTHPFHFLFPQVRAKTYEAGDRALLHEPRTCLVKLLHRDFIKSF